MIDKRPIPESEFPELVDMILKIIIWQNSDHTFVGDWAGRIRWEFEHWFLMPDNWASRDGKIHSIPTNPFNLVRKQKVRANRDRNAALTPFGKVRGQIWLN